MKERSKKLRSRPPLRWPGSVLALAIVVGPSLAIGACGGRSALDGILELDSDAVAASDGRIARPEGDARNPEEVSPANDAERAHDARVDPSVDGAIDDPDVDVLSPVFGIDAAVSENPTTCDTGEDSTAFLVSESGAFYSFDPIATTTHLLGTIHCPASANASPFTMTIAAGAAYVLYNDGNLFRVDLGSLRCDATSFVPSQLGFPGDVGIATSRRSAAAPEGLLVYGCIRDRDSCAPTIAKSDLSSFVLAEIGVVIPDPKAGYPVDVKADAYGRLFAFDAGGTLIAIDVATGAWLGADATGVVAGPDLALLTWRNRLFFFTQTNGEIHGYDLASKVVIALGSVGDAIVGAGSAPCIE